jgi:glycosyltransferase involved in cell wall biosynthesis
VDLVNTLARRGHRVKLVVLGTDVYGGRRLDWHENAELVRVPLPRPLSELGLVNLLRLLRPFAGGACVLVKGGLDRGSWRLDLAARLCFGRYVTVEQLTCDPMPPKTSRRYLGGLLPGLGLWWYGRLLSRRLRSVFPHRVVCVSDAVRRGLVTHYRFPGRKLRVVHNGINPSKYHPTAAWRQSCRSAWGVPEQALVLGAVGRLNPQKDYGLAVEAFARLMRARPGRDVRLVLVGEGPEREALQRTAAASGFGDRVIFPGPTDRAWEAYCAFDLFLMPSRNEGLPMALLEAMACGCCPVATDVGGVREVISDPGVGWLVPAGDREKFVAAVGEAAALAPEGRAALGQRARARVVAQFDARTQLAALARFVEGESGE